MRPGLDVSLLDQVIAVDAEARTADVQGMCTYEHLVEATLPHGLAPLVVPAAQDHHPRRRGHRARIESTSFRSGLPHESVLEMDILTGAGEIVTARPEGEHADLFHGFPNSYGTLGYATRLRIALEPVDPFVALRHVRFHDVESLVARWAPICDTGEHDGERVDYLDGVVFSADRVLPHPRRQTAAAGPGQRLHRPADLLPLDPARLAAAQGRPAHHPRLPLALGHRLVLVLAGPSARRTRASGGSGRVATAAARSTGS